MKQAPDQTTITKQTRPKQQNKQKINYKNKTKPNKNQTV